MGGLIVSVPDRCLSFYFKLFVYIKKWHRSGVFVLLRALALVPIVIVCPLSVWLLFILIRIAHYCTHTH